MKKRDTGDCSTWTARASGFSSNRRHLLLLGMAITGITLVRHILHIPPRTPGETIAGNRLSRHEACFYTAPGKQDR